MRDILFDLIGLPLNIVHTETIEVINDLTGGASSYISQVIEYDLEYIASFILVVIFNIGLFIILSNFQKSWSSYSRRNKK